MQGFHQILMQRVSYQSRYYRVPLFVQQGLLQLAPHGCLLGCLFTLHGDTCPDLFPQQLEPLLLQQVRLITA